MPAEQQAVTAFPEIINEKRTPQDEFIVLACDGIWDVMSSQEVVTKVREMLQHGRPELPPLDEPVMPGAGGGGSSSPSGPDGTAPAEPPPPPPPPRPWDLGAVAECLIDHCLRLGSRDNMSVIVVLLDQSMAPKPEGGAAAGRAAASSSSSGGSGGEPT